jgi:hypothetical protein
MTPRRVLPALLLAACLAAAAFAIAGSSQTTGRIGPASRIQPSGRLLNPTGRLTT